MDGEKAKKWICELEEMVKEEFNEKIGVMGPNIVYKDGEIYYTRVRGFHTPLPKTADKVAIDVSLIQGKGGSGFGWLPNLWKVRSRLYRRRIFSPSSADFHISFHDFPRAPEPKRLHQKIIFVSVGLERPLSARDECETSCNCEFF